MISILSISSKRMTLDISSIDIILADDEITNRVVGVMNLGIAGFDECRIHEVEDGEEAISKLEELQESDSDSPIICILDLHMPGGMDGNVAGIRIRENIAKYSKRKPFLVCCSAEVVEQLKERPWAWAMHSFAAKPLLDCVIQEMIQECERTYGDNT